MKAFRYFVGNQFAKEVHLDRPARTFGERIFRFSVYFFMMSSILGGLSEMIGVDKKIGDGMGFLMWPFSILFMFSFIYMLGFAYVRYVRPDKLKKGEPNKPVEPTSRRAPRSDSRLT